MRKKRKETNMQPDVRPAEPNDVVIHIGKLGLQRYAVSKKLNPLLGMTRFFYRETLSCRWHMSEPHFVGLHDMLEQQSEDLLSAVDAIGDRLQALGHYTPKPMSSISESASMRQSTLQPSQMMKGLVYANEDCLRVANEALDAAERAADNLSVLLLEDRIRAHTTAANMLNSILAITLTFNDLQREKLK